MAKRKALRGLWLLMYYITLWSWTRCKTVASAIGEPGQQNVRKPSNGQIAINGAASPISHVPGTSVSRIGRVNHAKHSFYDRGHGSRRSRLKSRYALFPSSPLSTLLSIYGHSGSLDGSRISSRHGLQRSILSHDSAVDPPVSGSASPEIDTVEHADTPTEDSIATRSAPKDQPIPEDPDVYDFIIVGCGAAGCPLASYLALKGEGRRVLVLERGLERTFEQAPRAMTIFSDGMAIGDEAISQPYVTRKGIRTHVAAVMGGGTAIDLAIYVEETKDYFDYLNKQYPAYKFHWPTIQQAYRYVRKVVARKMPQDTRFAHAYGKALRARGFEPVGGGEPAEHSSSVKVNKHWGSYSLFDVAHGGYRRAADVFLAELPKWARKNVDVRTRHVVERVEFDETQQPPRAKCVVYRPTSYADVKTQGVNFGHSLPASSAGWGPWIGTFLAPQTVLVAPETPIATNRFFFQSRTLRKVCINDKEGSEIILSAGAINTAVLLYKSGIGPLQQLKEIGARVIVENPHVGQMFSDRVFIPVSAFTANYADEVMPVSSKPVRRMAPRSDTRRPDKRTHLAAARSIRDDASTEGSAADDSSFLSRASEGAHGAVDRPWRTDKKQRSIQRIGDRGARRPDAHYRGKFSSAWGSLPIATLAREISDEPQISVTIPPSQSSSETTFVPAAPVLLDEDLVTPNAASAGRRGGPSRVVLADFKNSISPEITGRFVDVRYPQEGLLSPPRVCQAMGLKQAGPPDGCSAEHYSIGKRTLTCSLVIAEETSGGRSQEGVVLASRFIFPPALRNDPFVDVLFEILGACGDYKAPYGVPVFQPLCAIVMPVIKCFRKALATFHFIAEPKSRGFVHLRSDGAVEVDGSYLKEEQDLFDAVRGVSGLIEAMNGDAYRGILQPGGSAACPATVLNGLLDLIVTVGSTTSLFSTRKGNFALIQNYLQDLLPEKHRRLRRIIALDKDVKPRKLVATAVEETEGKDTFYQDGEEEPNKFILHDYKESVILDVDEERLAELGYKEKLKKVGFDFESFRSHLGSKSQPTHTNEEDSSRWFAARRVLQAMRPSEDISSAEKRKMHHTGAPEPPCEPKTSYTEQQLKEAQDACQKPCSATNDRGSCAAADVCCAAFGNSLCISTPENEAVERQLRDELSKASQLKPYDPTNDTGIQQATPAGTRGAAETSGSCDSGDESCVLRAVPPDWVLPTAVERMWGLMEKLPAAGAAFVKSFLPGASSSGHPVAGVVDTDSDHPPAKAPSESGSTQWAATFPPRLPDPYNPKDVARYALTYMSSVWHHCNTAPTGLVVNSDFEVIGTQRLSIVDASVVNQITRMNPLATLLMFGVYAAMKKLQKLGVVDRTPPMDTPGTSEVESDDHLHQE